MIVDLDLGTDAPSLFFDVDVQPMGGHVVVSVTGELDVCTTPRLRARLIEQAEAGRHTIVLDLARLQFTDSSGLGVMIGAFKRARPHGGAVCLLSPPAHVVKMLRMTGLTPKVFHLFTDLQAALDYLDTVAG